MLSWFLDLVESFVREHKARTMTVQDKPTQLIFFLAQLTLQHQLSTDTKALSNACQIVTASKKLVSGCDLGQDLAALRLARLS